MDPVAPIGAHVDIVGLTVLTISLAVAGAVAQRTAQHSLSYWVFGWATMALTGGLYAFGGSIAAQANFAAFVTDGLFAPLMYVGALAYASRRQVAWPLIVGVAAGLARGLFEMGALRDLQLLLGLVVAPAFLFAASVVVLRTQDSPPLRLPIALMLGLFGFEEAWDAHADWLSDRVVIPWFVLIVTAVPLAALQITSGVLSSRRAALSARRRSVRAERDRDLERGRFERIFDDARELIVEISDDSKIVYANAFACRLFGLEGEEVIGRSSIEFLSPEWQPRAQALWRRMLQESHHPAVVEAIDGQGAIRNIELTASRYTFREEDRIVVFGRDVTDRLRDEQELALHREDLERLVTQRSEQLEESRSLLRDQEHLATVGTLAAGVAHQINNPVGVIVAASEYALGSEGQPDRDHVRKEALERVLDAAHRVGRIVRSLLKFARQEATPKWREELQPVVHRASELSRGYVEGKGGKLVVVADGAPLFVSMSPIELEQVVMNLIHNAIEAQPGGGDVRVRLHREGDVAVIDVADDGVGIPPESLPRVFDPFFTTRLSEGGSGLGLAVAHGVVVDHGGTIHVDSEPGGGTRISIQLPLDERGDDALMK